MENFEYLIVSRERDGGWTEAGPEVETVTQVVAGQDEKTGPAAILNHFGADGWELIRTDYPGDGGTMFFMFKRPAPAGFALPASAAGDPRPA